MDNPNHGPLHDRNSCVVCLRADNDRLRAFILSLDGKTIAFKTGDNEFIDDGTIVASDILEQRGTSNDGAA